MFGREVVKDLIKKEVRKRAFDTNWRKSVPGGGSCKYKGPEAGITSKFLKKVFEDKVVMVTVE